MFSYRESSVALLNRMMSVMHVHSINALVDKVNEANASQGLRKLTWMTINNHTNGDRVFNRSSVSKITRAMRYVDSPQRSQLIELAERLADAADIERAVIKGRAIIGGRSLTDKQVTRVKAIHAQAVRQWRRSLNRAYGVSKRDLIAYIKNQQYSSISCLIKIMNHLQMRNLNRLTEWINDTLPEGMHLGGAILYTHLMDTRRLLSEGGIRIIEVAFMTDKSDQTLCSLARRFIKACAVEKFVVLCENRLGAVARKVIDIRRRDIASWNDIHKGMEFSDEQLTAHLEEGGSSIAIIGDILANLNVVSLNKFADVINKALPAEVRRINGGSLYGHFNELDKILPDNGIQAIVAALDIIGGPRREQLRELAQSLVEALQIERYALGQRKPTALVKKIVDRRKRDIRAKTSRPNFRAYRRSSHEICGEIMETLTVDHVEHWIVSINEGLSEINRGRTINQIPRMSPGIIYKHLRGASVLSDSSLNKISVAMTVQPRELRGKLQTLTTQLINACRVERMVIGDLLTDTDSNRKLVTKVNRLRTASINRYHRESRHLHAKRN